MISRCSALILAFLICSPALFHATQSKAQATPGESPYTFQANTRIVLTDVTVTDTKGNPVHGLPQSAFHIFDNKQPQVITSFEEHTGIPAATILPASTAGVYSNDYLLHLPPVLNIVLIDISNLDMADQMYLNYELTRFLNEQPEGQPLAIYLRAGSGCFIVQNFTSDRKLLLAAVHKAIPRFPPNGREYLRDYDTLQQIALSLSQLPGRKNILWFTGGPKLFLMPDAMPLQNDADWRDLYDDLDQQRIALYPIDARGLFVVSLRTVMALGDQHLTMDSEAKATGGAAFHNNNGLKEITEHILDSGSSFYTLTYSPHDLHFDNKWHKVRVAVDGASYHLSYRRGYFADGSVRDMDQPAKPRTRLLANGEKLEVAPVTAEQPIIFQASVLPESDPAVARRDKPSGSLPAPHAKKGSVPFSIRYTVPIDALAVRKNADGKHQVVFGIAAIALNRDGSLMEHDVEQVTMVLNEQAFRHSPDLPITLDQHLNLAKDDQFLNLGVWDTVNGRFGSIEIPLEVPKPVKHKGAGE
ncbi:MAG TPA: VWA domain-containing protein [Alloacidobacterium sp.]|nr:VWA domain-containing protein [Alloacidobacterium sp.]